MLVIQSSCNFVSNRYCAGRQLKMGVSKTETGTRGWIMAGATTLEFQSVEDVEEALQMLFDVRDIMDEETKKECRPKRAAKTKKVK